MKDIPLKDKTTGVAAKRYTLPLKDNTGRWRTYSLFWESRVEGYEPVFTYKDRPHEVDGITYPSLKQIYMSYDHVPGLEYEFAQDTFGSWDHWVRLCDGALKPYVAEWRTELEIKNAASAIKSLIQTSRSDNAAGASAAKYLAEKGYAPKRGRPSKEEVARERSIAAGVEKQLEDDLERLQLRVVNK